jgi:ketosteroid isomerase-like protein
MSNAEIAAGFNAAAEERAADRIRELVTEDAIWDMSRSRGPYSGMYRGYDEIRILLEGVIEAWEYMRFERLSLYEVGNLLAEEMKVTMKGQESGVEIVGQGARVYEFRGGRIARFVMFQDMDEARAYVDGISRSA